MNGDVKILDMIEELLEKPYWVIDLLPYQVPEESAGQYFVIEEYFLKDPQNKRLRQCFVEILLKLNCYCDFLVYQNDGEVIENPSPEQLEEMVLQNADIMDIILEEAMIVIRYDDTYMTVYDPDEKLLETLKPLVTANGLFLWKPNQE
ncbi:MAG: hypothetical protein IJI77_07105 [Erysipelotrichaceae bacterium]|nr:hypothetical protein [Erysipelotrichaceae bacterium]MBQ6126765.1 hypothetical protein [Erysipelotrichaceae bacterium]